MSNKIGLCKYCWEVLCSQCQENLIDDDSDHVSKAELRKWCEAVIQKEVVEERRSLRRCSEEDLEEIGHLDGMKEVLYRILEKFCNGEK